MTHTVAVLKCELAPFTNLFSSKSFLPIVTNTTFKWQLQVSMTSACNWASSPILSLLLFSPSTMPCLYSDSCRRRLTRFLTPSTSLHSALRIFPHARFALHILFVISPYAPLLHTSPYVWNSFVSGCQINTLRISNILLKIHLFP